jgi:hypothetical protein
MIDGPPPMQMPRVRFTIGQLMIVVAIAGVLGALLRVEGGGALAAVSVLIFMPALVAFLCPLLFVRPGRRPLVATWIACLWPLSIPWALNVTWALAYGFLGHPPRPVDHGIGLAILQGSMGLPLASCLFAMVICPCLLIPASDERIEAGGGWGARAIPVLLGMPVVLFAVGVILAWDPLGAFVWFID